MKYYTSQQPEPPFIEVENREALELYPELMWWESLDGVVLTLVIRQ